jgi:hypothetical protein
VGNYVALSELKSALGITGSTDDDFLNLAIDAAEQAIDDLCGRVFTAAGSTSARTYRAQPYLAVTDDISTLTGLVVKTDTSGDGTFDTTWAFRLPGRTVEQPRQGPRRVQPAGGRRLPVPGVRRRPRFAGSHR